MIYNNDTNKLCDYGCGNVAKYFFRTTKKYCCSDHFSRCEKIRNLLSKKLKGRISPTLGKKYSEESKRKISNTKIGKPRDEATRKKISEFRTGKKYEDLYGIIKSSLVKKKISEAGKGKIPYNKGQKISEETKIKIGLSCLGEKNGMFGKKMSLESKEKIKKSWTKEKREKMRKVMKEGKAVYLLSFIQNPSKPQVKLYEIVKKFYPTSILNYPLIELNYSLDIAIPDLKIWIESDGTYWHQDKEKDLIRQRKIENLGWKCIRYKIDYEKDIPIEEKIMEDINNVKYR